VICAAPAFALPCGRHGDCGTLLVTTAWLAAHQADPNLVALAIGDESEFDKAHIPARKPNSPSSCRPCRTGRDLGKARRSRRRKPTARRPPRLALDAMIADAPVAVPNTRHLAAPPNGSQNSTELKMIEVGTGECGNGDGGQSQEVAYQHYRQGASSQLLGNSVRPLHRGNACADGDLCMFPPRLPLVTVSTISRRFDGPC
jgi:hypothetical protein